MANFLLLIKKIVNYTKKDIDKGNTPPNIYQVCSCIKEAFCLSYAIRKNNNLFLYFKEERTLLKFQGNKLRFLGSDERSQALLLMKALDKVKNLSSFEKEKWIKSTPGIFVNSFKSEISIVLFLKSLEYEYLSLVFDSISALELPFLAHTYEYPKIEQFHKLKNLNNDFFVIPLNPFRKQRLVEFLRLIVENYPTMLEKITLIPLKKIKATQDKVLYINFQIDKRENKSIL